MTQLNNIIQKLQLSPHPEGGYYRETYRSEGMIDESSLDSDYFGKRNYSTCIYFLLTSDSFPAFHRILQDEIWHYYNGSLNLKMCRKFLQIHTEHHLKIIRNIIK